MMGRFVGLLVLASAVASCDVTGVFASTQVRVENASNVQFDHVMYWAGSEQVTHSVLAPSEATPFVDADQAYGFTTVEVVAGGDTIRLQVIDYVGETPLSSGRYTYVLGLDGPDGSRSLTQELRKDP